MPITVREITSRDAGSATSIRDREFDTRRDALTFIGPLNQLSFIQRFPQRYHITRKKS